MRSDQGLGTVKKQVSRAFPDIEGRREARPGEHDGYSSIGIKGLQWQLLRGVRESCWERLLGMGIA